MEGSIGQETEPTTNTATTNDSGAPVAREVDSPDDVAAPPTTPELDDLVRTRLRDLPPSPMGENTGIIDLDELQHAADPLDERRPGRPTDDPLDPEGHLS